MDKQSECIVSEKEIFPLIEQQLLNGYAVRFTVSGNSMWPLIISNRDSVLLRLCNSEHLCKGDIILFRVMETHHVLHRITKVVSGGYITTGDGNLHRDGFVTYEDVIAKVEKIYRKDRIIICKKWYWKVLFEIWMTAYPIRFYLQKLILRIRK